MTDDWNDEEIEIIEYTLTPKAKELVTLINNFWAALNALPDLCTDLYLEDITRNEDMQDIELVANVMESEHYETPSLALLSELGEDHLDPLVERGLLEKKVTVIKEGDTCHD